MPLKNKLYRVGSRESALALAQTDLFIRGITEKAPELTFEILPMKTTGDVILDRSLEEIGGKGLFIKELDRALLDGEIDLAVHSLKDMPAEISPGLKIAAFSKREDPRDVLVLPEGGVSFDDSKTIGCSSRRRTLQLAAIFSGGVTAPVRGNVLTRLAKLDRGDYGALVLAAAGLKRLGLGNRVSRYFGTKEIVPSAGQGILCAVTREEDTFDFFRFVNDDDAALCALAERSFVKALGGDCTSPIGAFAEGNGGALLLNGLYFEKDGRVFRGSMSAPLIENGEKSAARACAVALGFSLAKELLAHE
jgi:hydroxymethylbilane synthase